MPSKRVYSENEKAVRRLIKNKATHCYFCGQPFLQGFAGRMKVASYLKEYNNETTEENCVAMCDACHKRKKGKTEQEFNNYCALVVGMSKVLSDDKGNKKLKFMYDYIIDAKKNGAEYYRYFGMSLPLRHVLQGLKEISHVKGVILK